MLYRPFGAAAASTCIPTAHAVGFILAPLRGLKANYWTVSVIAWERVALPEVALMVMVYVPAGVPPVAVGADELLPQADWNTTRPNRPATHTPSSHLRRRELAPAPSRVKPDTGSRTAYHKARAWRRDVVLTGRAVVEIVRVELAGLVLLIVSVLVENVHDACVGTPEAQDSETLLGYVGIGVTVTWYVAVFPAVMVCGAVGLTAMEKSVTLIVSDFELAVDEPADVTVPLFEKTGEAVVGVIVTLTVAVAPTVSVPIEQTTVVPLGEPQGPGLLLMDPAPEHVSFDTVLELTTGDYVVKGDADAG